jgi:PAS domain S-box-containing protein
MKTDEIRVLLVEDDEDDYLLTRDMLAEAGGGRYVLEWVASYQEALDVIKQRRHDVCLVDYRLGERTGLDLLREGAGLGCAAPIILLTGQGDQDVDLAAMKAGAADYLIKRMTASQSLDRAIRYALEHKHQEEALREREERFHALYDDNPSMYFTVAPDGTVQSVNRFGAQRLGYQPGELVGGSVLKVVHDDDHEDASQGLAVAFAHPERVVTMEFRKVKKNKDVIWVQETIRVLPAAAAAAAGTGPVALIVCEDITERKRAEGALQFAKYTIDRASDAIYWVAPDAKILDVNDAACAMLGYTKDEFRTMTVHDLNLDFQADTWPAYWEESRRRGAMVIETRHRAKDGRIIPIEVTVNFLTYEGKEYHCAFVRNITERKQAEKALRESEERLRLAQFSTDVGIWDWDTKMNKLTWTPELEAIYGLEPGTVHSYDDFSRRVHPDDIASVEAVRSKAVQDQKPFDLEFRIIRPSGEMRWISARGRGFYDESGRLIRVLGNNMDITERKQVEQLLTNLVEGTASVTGEAFFPALVQRLASAMGAPFALVTELAGRSRTKLRTLAVWEGDGPGQDFEYDTLGTPCEVVLSKGSAYYPTGVRALFPDDQDLVELEADGYLGHVLRDAQGEPIGHLCVLTTTPLRIGNQALPIMAVFSARAAAELQRKQAEEQLWELHLALANAMPGISLLNPQGRYEEVNDAYARMLGYESSELIGCDWAPTVAPEDRGVAHEAYQRMLSEGSGEFEARAVRKDGSSFFKHVLMVKRTAKDGALLGHHCFMRDISTRKHLEEEAARAQHFLNSILENIPHMIVVKDARSLRFARFNRAGEELVGFSREELLGKSDYDLFPQEEADFFAKKDREVLASGRLLEIPEEPIQTRSKGERLLRTKKIPLFNEKGEPEYLLGISEDITERVQLEQRLRQAEKMEAIGTLAGGIAHDFNNILSAMIGYTELSLDGVQPGSRARQNLDQVLVAGRRAKALIQQILAFSRRRDPQREVFALDRLLQEATTLLRASIPTTINMRVDLQGGESRVLADPTQLQQVIINLCSNAAQAMQQTGGTLDLVLEKLDLTSSFAAAHPPLKPGPHVRLTVRDTGVGMDPEVLRRIFDPFFTTKKVGEGTGLGLSAALGIVTSHGGTITVQSERGRGSTFSVYLPQFTASPVDVDRTPSAIRGGSERILFIDDEAALARLGEQMLGNLGYRVTAMTDPVLALGQFRNAPDAFDLVMTDQTMPGLTGDALARELTRIRPGLPVILCTGYTQGFSEQTAREIGISAFLMKPLEVAEVDQAIRRVLNQAAR